VGQCAALHHCGVWLGGHPSLPTGSLVAVMTLAMPRMPGTVGTPNMLVLDMPQPHAWPLTVQWRSKGDGGGACVCKCVRGWYVWACAHLFAMPAHPTLWHATYM
jgi:hypothetical protein